MSKAAIRSKKYAKAIRTGIMIGRSEAVNYGQHATIYRMPSLVIESGYDLFSNTNMFELVYGVANKVFNKEKFKLIDNVWSAEEYARRKENVKLKNMSSKEREYYLLRKEVEQLRSEVASWNKP